MIISQINWKTDHILVIYDYFTGKLKNRWTHFCFKKCEISFTFPVIFDGAIKHSDSPSRLPLLLLSKTALTRCYSYGTNFKRCLNSLGMFTWSNCMLSTWSCIYFVSHLWLFHFFHRINNKFHSITLKAILFSNPHHPPSMAVLKAGRLMLLYQSINLLFSVVFLVFCLILSDWNLWYCLKSIFLQTQTYPREKEWSKGKIQKEHCMMWKSQFT